MESLCRNLFSTSLCMQIYVCVHACVHAHERERNVDTLLMRLNCYVFMHKILTTVLIKSNCYVFMHKILTTF